MNVSWQRRAAQHPRMCDILIEWGWFWTTQTTYRDRAAKTPVQAQAQIVGRFITIKPKCQKLTKLFSRCFRKSMWWKGSFPPKHRQLSCCSFYLGWSINLLPDLAYATALLRGGLMCSTSPLMEALPRLSQISKTDTLGFPPGGKAHHCCDPFWSKGMFVSLAVLLHHRTCKMSFKMSPEHFFFFLDVPGLNLDSLCIFCKKKKKGTEFKSLTPADKIQREKGKKEKKEKIFITFCTPPV